MIAKPTAGPRITRANEEIIDLLSEKTFRRVNAIPKDIKIRNIVANINHSVVLITTTGKLISLNKIKDGKLF